MEARSRKPYLYYLSIKYGRHRFHFQEILDILCCESVSVLFFLLLRFAGINVIVHQEYLQLILINNLSTLILILLELVKIASTFFATTLIIKIGRQIVYTIIHFEVYYKVYALLEL